MERQFNEHGEERVYHKTSGDRATVLLRAGGKVWVEVDGKGPDSWEPDVAVTADPWPEGMRATWEIII